ncbi:MAG TPA: lysophospholipase [Spirochaetales bacterium]|nr:lysophospholipase [Spirochaetales bacterium]
MKNGDVTLRMDDGVEVFARRFEPESKPRGVLVVAHGVAEHSGRYESLAARLSKEGWVLIVPDHRGHGRTAASSGGRGWFAPSKGFFRVVEDLHAFRLFAEREWPGLPVALLGHSMGSSLARAYIALHGEGLAACALSGIIAIPPALAAASGAVVGLGRLLQGGRGIAKFADSITLGGYAKSFEPVRTRNDWLSRDTAQVDAYNADPDCGFTCTWDFFRDMSEGSAYLRKPSTLGRVPKNLPVLVFAGSRDPVGAASGGVEALVAAYRAAGLVDVTSKLYPEGRHEMLNETNRAEVMDDLAAWLGRAFGGGRGGAKA